MSDPEKSGHDHLLVQLLIVRYLFREGVHALESNLPYSSSLAVSLFQDAAELLLASIAIVVDAKVSPNTSFLAYWDLIESAPKNPNRKVVPSKAALARLNGARVAFKHRGQLIQQDDANRIRIDTEVFLKQTTSLFFDREFDAISLIDLVARQDVRENLRKAEILLASGEIDGALLSCAIAHYELSATYSDLVPEIAWTLEHDARDLLPGQDGMAFEQIIRKIVDSAKEHREVILQLVVRSNVEHYARFKKLTPIVAKTENGKYRHEWGWKGKRVSEDRDEVLDEVRFCIEFVLQSALRSQAQ